MRVVVPLHRFPKELQFGLTIAALYCDSFEIFPFMIERAPKVVLLATYFH